MKEMVTLQITLLHKSFFFFFPLFKQKSPFQSLHDDADLERHTSHHQSSQIKEDKSTKTFRVCHIYPVTHVVKEKQKGGGCDTYY